MSTFEKFKNKKNVRAPLFQNAYECNYFAHRYLRALTLAVVLRVLIPQSIGLQCFRASRFPNAYDCNGFERHDLTKFTFAPVWRVTLSESL